MKKTLLLIAAFLLTFTISYAQTEKGNQTLGGNLSYSYSNGNGTTSDYNGSIFNLENKSNTFGIGPNYSYFIANKMDVGLALSYGTSSSTNTPSPNYLAKVSSYSYGGTLYLRKYFMYQDKIGIRTGPYLGYDRSSSKYDYTNIPQQTGKTDEYNAGIKMDLVYYPMKKLGVSASLANLYYTHFKVDNGSTAQNSKGDNLGFAFINNNLALSVFFVFGK